MPRGEVINEGEVKRFMPGICRAGNWQVTYPPHWAVNLQTPKIGKGPQLLKPST
jgi:hypothetical protein